MTLHVISDFTKGEGAQMMLARLLRVAREERPVLVSLGGVSDRLRDLVANPRVHFVPLELRRSIAAPAAVFHLARLIRTERPAAILCWMYHAMPVGLAAARLARTGVPVHWTVRQALDDPEALTSSTRRALALAARLSPMASGVLYNSQRARDQHAAFGFFDRAATVVPNGFELPSITPPGPRQVRVFGMAGRFHPQKDHETFFRAAALVASKRPEARFVLAGGGLSLGAPEVEASLARAGLPVSRVELRGRLEGMEAFYDEIDVLVLSSRTEGFPNVLGEAMAHAKPVVSTDVGDAAAIVGEAGQIVRPRDPSALANAMLSMMDLPPAAYQAMATAARARVESRYALDVVAAQYNEFLSSHDRYRGAA